MSGALNSIFGGGSPLGAILNIASLAFPPAAIASALTNLVTQVVGQAVTQALQQLTQGGDMPKFIAQEIGNLVKDVLSKLTQQGDPACEQQVQDKGGAAAQDWAKDFCEQLVNDAAKHMGGEKKKGGGSWYEALAKALGESLDKQAANIEKLSGSITDANAKDKPSTMTELQTASQRMSFMMSACDQVLKTLGEALSTMARKQ